MRTPFEQSKETALRQGIQKVFPRIWRYALTLTGSRADADDLAQSACLRAIEKADLFDPSQHLDRWMFRITSNLWVSEMRRQKVRRGNGLVGVEMADIVDFTQNADDKFERRELLQSVLRLPEVQRQTVVLVYVEGYSYRDAAMILDIPIGTVMSRLAAARSTLAMKFRDAGDGRNAN